MESKHQVASGGEDYCNKSPNTNPSFIKNMEHSKFSSLAKTIDDPGSRYVINFKFSNFVEIYHFALLINNANIDHKTSWFNYSVAYDNDKVKYL